MTKQTLHPKSSRATNSIYSILTWLIRRRLQLIKSKGIDRNEGMLEVEGGLVLVKTRLVFYGLPRDRRIRTLRSGLLIGIGITVRGLTEGLKVVLIRGFYSCIFSSRRCFTANRWIGVQGASRYFGSVPMIASHTSNICTKRYLLYEMDHKSRFIKTFGPYYGKSKSTFAMQTYNLLIIIALIFVHLHVEESQLIHTFLCRDNPQPIPQLQISLLFSCGHTFCFFKNFFVRYFKYRPLNLAPFATTTIFPCSREIVMLSPKFPVRLSTLILSWRNFSKAEGSKILSFVGADASRTYCRQHPFRQREAYFLGLFLCGGFAGFLDESAYCI